MKLTVEDIGRACKPRFEQHLILAHGRFAHWNHFFRITTSKGDLQYMKMVALTSIHLSKVNNKDITRCLSVLTVHHSQKFGKLSVRKMVEILFKYRKRRYFMISLLMRIRIMCIFHYWVFFIMLLEINLRKGRKVKISRDQKNIFLFALFQRSHKMPQIIHPTLPHIPPPNCTQYRQM